MRTAADLMTRELITLAEDDTLDHAQRLASRAHIRHLPVVREGLLVGLLSHGDLLRCPGDRRGCTAVRELMTLELKTVHPQTPLRTVFQRMRLERLGAMPVVDLERRLVGIITQHDAVLAAEHLLEELERGEPLADYELAG